MKTIICPTDFSKNADTAFQYGLEVATAINAKIFLLHAYEVPIAFSEMPLTSVHHADKQLLEQAQKNLDDLKQKAGIKYPDIEIETIAVHGLAPDHIIRYADFHSADLIIMGTTGLGMVERFLIGSTASKVIQNANCPVFCIPPGKKYSKPVKIVFATDLHEDNLQASVRLAGFTKMFGAEIIFLFVDKEHLIHTDEAIHKMTEKIRKRIKYPKISGYVCREKTITKGIDYFLQQHPVDILAMYTHKKSFAEGFHSSITKSMASHTTIPLLVFQQSEKFMFEENPAVYS